MVLANVIVDITHTEVDKVFTYKVPELLVEKAEIGMRVLVPFGRGKDVSGVLISFCDTVAFDTEKLKSIIKLLDEFPIISERLISLAMWMSEKYSVTLSQAINTIIPSGIALTSEKMIRLTDVSAADAEPITEKQAEIIALLDKNDGIVSQAYLLTELHLPGIKDELTKLRERGLIETYTKVKEKKFTKKQKTDTQNQDAPTPYESDFVYTTEQETILRAMKAQIAKKEHKPMLLHGITGSGKTEVYLSLIKQMIDDGKQIILLVPEISLTSQMVTRVKQRFDTLLSVTHSRLTAKERFTEWKKANDGETAIIIGPRSALFTPFKRLGLIIIDEEHEHTYKSELSPKYDARDVAAKRCEIESGTLLLGSATPSLESYYKAKMGQYALYEINERVNVHGLPTIHIVDMGQELRNGNRSMISHELQCAMDENLKNGKQTILFLNRRGHSSFVSCRNCGHVMKCDNCNVSLTYHRKNGNLLCHYCGSTAKLPEICPICGSEYIRLFGVGTQKVEEEVEKLFLNAKIARMDYDTTKKKHSHAKILNEFAAGKADILIGTQMIAKGHDFPNVTLVGIIAADLSLHQSDFRASENTFQLITQVAGRAGRSIHKGEVYLQTYAPHHYAVELAATQDYKAFYESEIQIRTEREYPPLTHIFSIMFTGPNEKELVTAIYEFSDICKYYTRTKDYKLFGPTPCAVSKINNEYRWRIFAKNADEQKLKNYCFYCIDKFKKKNKIKNICISVSLDPYQTI